MQFTDLIERTVHAIFSRLFNVICRRRILTFFVVQGRVLAATRIRHPLEAANVALLHSIRRTAGSRLMPSLRRAESLMVH